MARKPVSEWTLEKDGKKWTTTDPVERVALLGAGWKHVVDGGVRTKVRAPEVKKAD